MIKIKKRSLLFLIITFLIFCSSCSQSDASKEIDYSKFLNNQDINTNDKAPADKAADITTSAQSGEATGVNTTTASQDVNNNTALPWNWPSDMDFTGVKSEMKDFKLGNLSSNFIINASATCLFCPNKQNNTIYYMSRKDRFIYEQKGDNNTLLVEMQAHNLQLWDNKLYFINIKKTNYYASGPIYSYDLETKELELVLDKNIALFYIDNYGIYYSELGDSQQLKVNLLDFNNKNTSLDDYPWVISYNEYLLTLLEGNLSLINRNTDEIIKIMPFEDNIKVISTIHIFENRLVFAVDTCIYVLDLITGDKKSYNAIQADAFLKLSLKRIVDFVFVDNNIFASYGCKNIIKLDLDKDNIHDCISFDQRNVTYSFLQTNGERLFATVFLFEPASVKSTVIGYDEIFIPDEGNVLTRREFGQ